MCVVVLILLLLLLLLIISCVGAKIVLLRTLGVDNFKNKLCDAIKQVPQSRITVKQAHNENLRNVLIVRSEQSFIGGFANIDIDCMIVHFTVTNFKLLCLISIITRECGICHVVSFATSLL